MFGHRQQIYRILITDDTKLHRAMLKHQIEINCAIHPEEYSIDEAVDGEDALAKVENLVKYKNKYDLIFMDYHMPKLNGEAATAAIREIEKTNKCAPCYIVTYSEGRKEIFPGSNCVLPKPASTIDLRDLFTSLNIPLFEIRKRHTI